MEKPLTRGMPRFRERLTLCGDGIRIHVGWDDTVAAALFGQVKSPVRGPHYIGQGS
jgi:hypothetical protein